MCSAGDPDYMKLMRFRFQRPAWYAEVIGVARWLIEQGPFGLRSVPDQGDGLIMQGRERRVNGYVVLL
ncbi:hypothetical protein AO269_15165 [Pseudomonas putida]|jgi:hypothetical protein|nr:hypothetical protein AO269_15165 [Pseudomonas putida]